MYFDIDFVRDETPGCKNVIHFDNAGAALMPRTVIEAVNNYFSLEAAIGGYPAAEKEQDKIEGFYNAASKLINASSNEIAYIESATRAWEMFFYSLNFKAGDKIITSQAEYASNFIAFLQVSKKTGVIIEVIGNDDVGQVSLDELEKKIDSKVKLIAITHVPTQGGLVNPAIEIGKIANKHNVLYLLDTTQSIGQMPIDVKKIGCDALCATGRKYLRGPRGTGFLFVKESVLETLDPPSLDLQAATWTSINSFSLKPDAKRFETWERNCGNMLGLRAAIEYAMSLDPNVIWHRVRYLGELFRAKLDSVKGVEVRDLGDVKCGIVTFTTDFMSPEEIKQKLKDKKINVSVSFAEYARLDLDPRHIKSLVRASVHYYNTVDEIDEFCETLRNL